MSPRAGRLHLAGRWALPWALAALCAHPAGAASAVYRCGQTYQQTPCPAGQVLNIDDSRSPGQQREAREAMAADQRVARQLAAERKAREKTLKPQTQAAGIRAPGPAPAASAAAAPDVDPLCAAHRGKKVKVRCRNGQPLYLAPSPAAK